MEMHDTGKTQSAALKWLYEMEALDSPVLRQNLYENVFMAHLGIKDCKLFITPPNSNQKGVLIWLKLRFWQNLFSKDDAYSAVTQVINNLLPSYRVRIVDDESILTLAEKRVKEVYGGQNETNKTTNTDSLSGNSNNAHSEGSDSESKSNDMSKTETSDILPDSEEQAKAKQEVCNEVKQLDPQVDEKAQSPS